MLNIKVAWLLKNRTYPRITQKHDKKKNTN